MKCYDCGEKMTMDDSLGAEVATRKGKPVWKDVCHDCYYEIVKTCQICGSDDVMPSDVSRFILVKYELAGTADRPPGIYQILSYPFLSIPMVGSGSMGKHDVLFIDRLPKPDRHYEISGHICRGCAQPYSKMRRRIYGRKKMTSSWRLKTWQIQREHTRNVILANPDMLRDLECEKDDNDWKDLRNQFCLPPELPTYHDWLLLKYRGVKVFKTYQTDNAGDGWLVLKPEPKYRRLAYCSGDDSAGVLFTASSLPTFPKMPKAKPGEYRSHLDWARQHSLTAIRKAIALGLITKQGTFNKRGKPFLYR